MPTVDSLDIQISTSLKNTDKMIDNLIAKLNVLNSSLSRIGGSSANISSGMTKMSSSATKSTKSFNGLASAFGRFYANYFLLVRAIKGFNKAITGTADYIEAFNYFEVSFNKIAKEWKQDFSKYGKEIGASTAEEYSESFAKRAKDSLSKLSGVQLNIDTDGKGLLSETGLKNLGLNIKEITEYSAQLASITNSVGQTGEISLRASNAFTKLAGDISSLFNQDYTSVAKNLQSGLIGQSRALYKYGIDITNATLQTYAYNLGLEKAVSEMTQAEKMQLRMIAILEQSKVSWGDLANTINSPSNMIRQFKNNLKEAGMMLGQLFIPLLQKVLPVINGVTIALKRLLGNIAGILGIELDLSAFGQGSYELEDSYGDVSDSLDDVAESAKKAKAGLRGFDELKTIKMSESSKNNSGLNDTIDLTNEIIKATEEYEKVWQAAYDKMEQTAQKFADSIEKIFAPIEKLFIDIKNKDWFVVGEDVSAMANSILDFALNAINKTNWDKVGTSFGDFFEGSMNESFKGLPKLGYLITSATDAINNFLTNAMKSVDWGKSTGKLLKGLRGFLKNLNISKMIGGLTKVINSVNQVIIDSIDYLIKNPGEITKLIGLLVLKIIELIIATAISQTNITATSIAKIMESVLTTGIDRAKKTKKAVLKAKEWIQSTFTDGVNAFEEGDFKEWLVEKLNSIFDFVFKNIKIEGNFVEKIKENWSIEPNWFNDNIIEPQKIAWSSLAKWIDNTFITPLSGKFSNFTENIRKVFEGLKIIIQAIWITMSNWFNESVVQPILNIFSPIGERVSTFFSNAYQKTKEKWKEAKKWFNDTVNSPLENSFKKSTDSIAGYFTNIWKSIKKGAVSAFNGVLGAIENGINFLVSGLNAIIKGFNRVVGWASEITGDKWESVKTVKEITIKRIPIGSYEVGGFPKSADLFFANENGVPELVGTMGGKTAVASGMEITGIKDAIYSTGKQETTLMETMVGLLRIIADKEFGITESQIGKSAQRYARDYFNRTGNEAYSF